MFAGRFPVLLGGAALTRSYVEDDLRDLFDGGEVHYARDAFEGLALMDRVMTAKRGGATNLDCRHDASLGQAHVAGVGRAPRLTMAAEDIRDLQLGSPRKSGAR